MTSFLNKKVAELSMIFQSSGDFRRFLFSLTFKSKILIITFIELVNRFKCYNTIIFNLINVKSKRESQYSEYYHQYGLEVDLKDSKSIIH